MKGLINIQNEDNDYFKWCLVRYLKPVHKYLARIGNVDKEFPKKLNFKGAKFPVYKGDCTKTEKKYFH